MFVIWSFGVGIERMGDIEESWTDHCYYIAED